MFKGTYEEAKHELSSLLIDYQENTFERVQELFIFMYNSMDWNYVAHWVDLNGSTKFKWFSILKYGENGAFTLAMKAREDAIANLIENGEWYGEPIEESNVEDNERNNHAKT